MNTAILPRLPLGDRNVYYSIHPSSSLLQENVSQPSLSYLPFALTSPRKLYYNNFRDVSLAVVQEKFQICL